MTPDPQAVLGYDNTPCSCGAGYSFVLLNSALRYRVQAPMIDSLMREIGIEGGSLGRLTDVLRDAKDISALTRDSKTGPKEKGAKAQEKTPKPEENEDRDR